MVAHSITTVRWHVNRPIVVLTHSGAGLRSQLGIEHAGWKHTVRLYSNLHTECCSAE